MTVFWFRRDLRVADNCGLFHALDTADQVLPIFIFDDNILAELPRDDARVTFLHELLQNIDSALKLHNRKLAVFHGEPKAIFSDLIREHDVQDVFANHDYEPYAIKRDKAVAQLLHEQGVGFKTFKDQVVFEKNEVAKDNGEPYVVFTPYSKRWLEKLGKAGLETFGSETKLANIADHEYPLLSLADIGFKPSKTKVEDFDLSANRIHNYEATRNFPATDGTSHLGPHLRHGAISIRKVIGKALADDNPAFLKELIWREFFMQVLWHFPKTVNHAFKPAYDRIQWRYAQKEFGKWCRGKTGYPIVDAGMRELNQTGYMHNRVRMVTASFLCKHLLIDWRWGEAYFAEKLLDYEQSSNVGNWQWAAGSGVDAAPYFRIFNPAEQLRKFDKDSAYVKKWVREFGTGHYPEPMVNHKEARERCLRVYNEGLNGFLSLPRPKRSERMK